MRKLSEIETLKYWIDAEFTIIHAMFGFIALLLLESTWQEVLAVLYIIGCIAYAMIRLAIVVTQDREYLKVPKQ